MIMKKLRLRHCLALFAALWLLLPPASPAQEVPLVSIERLQARLAAGEVLVLDVRVGKSWDDSHVKIPGARRVDPKNVDGWAGSLAREQPIVLYCA